MILARSTQVTPGWLSWQTSRVLQAVQNKGPNVWSGNIFTEEVKSSNSPVCTKREKEPPNGLLFALEIEGYAPLT